MFACAAPDHAATDASPAVAGSDRVARGPFEKHLLLTGEIQAVRSISLKAPQTSLFQMRIQFMAEEGSLVERGDPVLTFDNSSLAAQVHDLETSILDAETQIVAKRNELSSALKDLEIELAEKRYEFDRARLDASVDPEVLSRKEYGERQLAFTRAQRELDETRERVELTQSRGRAELDVLVISRDKLQQDLLSAREGLDLLTIEAPAEGLVVYEKRPQTTLRFQEGDSCWPGQNIMQLPDLSAMRVIFMVNEVDAALLEEGMPVRVTLDAFPGRELDATIVTIPSMAVKRDDDSKIAVFKVIASLSETWVGDMKPGMSVLGRITLDRSDDVPIVARRSVRFDGQEYWLQPAEPATEGGPGRKFHPVERNATHYRISEEEFRQLTGPADRGGGA